MWYSLRKYFILVKNKNDYENFIIYLTDSNENINESFFDIDPNITDER